MKINKILFVFFMFSVMACITFAYANQFLLKKEEKNNVSIATLQDTAAECALEIEKNIITTTLSVTADIHNRLCNAFICYANGDKKSLLKSKKRKELEEFINLANQLKEAHDLFVKTSQKMCILLADQQ